MLTVSAGSRAFAETTRNGLVRLPTRVLGCWLTTLAIIGSAQATPAEHAGEPHRSKPTITLRIGIVAIDDPSTSPENKVLVFLRDYFERVREYTEVHTPFVLALEPVKGSYYQVFQWTRDGLIDGAVVPPFCAYLLTNDPGLAAFPVVEFQRADAEPPARVLAMDPKDKYEPHLTRKPPLDPNKELTNCVKSMIKSVHNPSTKQRCELELVNHLSTTGFLYPLVRANEILGEARPKLSDSDQEIFWKRFMEWSRFTMMHTPTARGANLEQISFSYKTRPHDARLQLSETPPWLNDVLLLAVKRRTPGVCGADDNSRHRLIDSEGTRRLPWQLLVSSSQPEHSLWILAGKAIAPNDYERVASWDESLRAKFAETVGRTFHVGLQPGSQRSRSLVSPGALERLYSDWYERGHFAFTIDELVDLLIDDQRLRENRCAALVLPGGGVRATYQSVILDALYTRRIVNDPPKLENGRIQCGKAPDARNPQRLRIAAIAGTSGGALLGALAARRKPVKSNALTNPWIKDGEVKTTPASVFPPFGIFRWMSVLLALTVFAASAAIHWPPHGPTAKEVPAWYTTTLTLVVAGAPFLIWHNNPAYLARWEGVAYAVVVLTVHFFHSVSIPGGGIAKGNRTLAIGIVITACGCGEAWVLIALVGRNPGPSGYWSNLAMSVQAFAETKLWTFSALPVIIVVLGIVVVAYSQGIQPDGGRMTNYRWSLAVIFLSLLLPATIFFLIGLWTGAVTELEMTVGYWIWVLCSALFAGKLTIEIFRTWVGEHRLVDGLKFLITPSGTAPFPYTPTVTLILWGTLGIATYLIFIAPALYSSDDGRAFFNATVHESTGEPGMADKSLAPLIVSMTGLGGRARGFTSARGDYYAYDDLWRSHVDPSRSSTFSMPGRDFPDAVFASGSPFPIYPAAIVPLSDGRGLFVDGGYAHRVPIDAALATGAGQILVIENVPRHGDTPDPDTGLGRLSDNVFRAFNYLLDRSQELDLQRSRSVLVGTIYPEWAGENPFLMDFRREVVLALQREAIKDLGRSRVARVESWGQPLISEPNGMTP